MEIKPRYAEPPCLEKFSSGSFMVDRVVCGGFPLGRAINVVGDFSSGKCAKNIYVSSPTEGLFKLDDIAHKFKDGATPWETELLLENGKTVKTSHFYKEKVQKTIKIKTIDGFVIEGTPDHKIKIATPEHTFDMKKLNDITETDVPVLSVSKGVFPKKYVSLCENLRSLKIYKSDKIEPSFLPEVLDEDLAWFLGILVADGDFYEDASFFIKSSDPHVHDVIFSICNKYGITIFYVESNGKMLGIDFTSCVFRDFLLSIFDKTSLVSGFKKLPPAILKSPQTVQASFLKGLDDSNSFFKMTPFEYNTTSKDLSEQISLMLLHHGLFLSKGSLSSAYLFSPIKTIDVFNEETYVFDVCVPDGHLFWGNGFINHNTMLMIETCASFANTYPDGMIRYVETESAFDVNYASSIGLPVERVDLVSDLTVIEDIFKDFEKFISSNPDTKKLYILDSLDAVSDTEEMERDIDKGSFGGAKPKLMGQFFRRLNSKSSKNLCTLIIVSQVRADIGAMYGDKQRRSGGKALDFYSSIVLWLNRIGTIQKTVSGVKRTTGIVTKIKTKKNKVGVPFKEGLLHINFTYGSDDEISCLEWIRRDLKKNTIALGGKDFNIQNLELAIKKARVDQKYNLLKKLRVDILSETGRLWDEIESKFKPTTSKKDIMESEMSSTLDDLRVSDKTSSKKSNDDDDELEDSIDG